MRPMSGHSSTPCCLHHALSQVLGLLSNLVSRTFEFQVN